MNYGRVIPIPLRKRRTWRLSRSQQEQLSRLFALCILVPGMVVVLIPVVWMLAVSLEEMSQVASFPPSLWPHPFVWDNYAKAFTLLPFGQYFFNTARYAVLRVIGVTISASLAGFAFARLRAPDRDMLFALVLSTLMLPYTVTMIPQFIMFKTFGWTNSYKPLIVPGFFAVAPFIVFLFRQFFRSVSEEVFEAARMDGCNYPQLYAYIMVPLALPVFATASILLFQGAWDDLLGPLIYINSNTKYTVSLALATLRSVLGGSPWNEIMAVSLIAALPPVLLFFFFQRYIISGVVVVSK